MRKPTLSRKRRFTVTVFVMGALWLGTGITSFSQDSPADAPDAIGSLLAESAATRPSWLTVEGVLEVEAFSQSWGEDDSTDIVLATAELSIVAEPEEGIRGTLVLLWEEDGTDSVEVDVATVTLGGTDVFPLTLEAGRLYVPFGSFESLMVSDPLTLELGESRQTAAALTWSHSIVDVTVAVFSGELETDDTLENAAAAVTLSPLDGLRFGVSAVTDIGQGGLADAIDESLAEGASRDRIAGISAFVVAECGNFTLSAEYLGAAKRQKLVDGDDDAVRPRAWFVDLGYAFDDKWFVAARYEGSRDFLPKEMPELQFGAMVSCAIGEHATLSIEHLVGRFDDSALDDRQLTTVQLALTF